MSSNEQQRFEKILNNYGFYLDWNEKGDKLIQVGSREHSDGEFNQALLWLNSLHKRPFLRTTNNNKSNSNEDNSVKVKE